MYYFAYAANLNLKRMRERCPDSKPMFLAARPDYKLVFAGWSRQWRGGTATIKLFKGEIIRGAIYEVSERDLRRLDKHEGCPGNYDRLKVTVFDEDGSPMEAETYTKSGKLEEAPHAKEYLAIIQQGYRDWRII
jgi:gamma-glutamylcyclotransferase (GGCT)/AIG2-like uncharacterized protein YtfP